MKQIGHPLKVSLIFQHGCVLIAGPGPPPEIKALQRDPSISVLGFVDDLTGLYKKCRCAVAPILRGSGTRIKILEAMAAGIPVVSTTIGAEGIDANEAEHLLVADNPGDFANAVLLVISDDELALRLSKNARNLVKRKYDWDLIAEDLYLIYEGL